MSKRTLLIVTVIISSFFVVLGMRNPDLNRSPAPKQRPRAVIESVSKTSDRVVAQSVSAVVTLSAVLPAPPRPIPNNQLVPEIYSPPHSPLLASHSSRAPPLS